MMTPYGEMALDFFTELNVARMFEYSAEFGLHFSLDQ